MPIQITLTTEQHDFLLSILTSVVEQYEHDAAGMIQMSQLGPQFEAAKDIAVDLFQKAQNAAELVSLLAQH